MFTWPLALAPATSSYYLPASSPDALPPMAPSTCHYSTTCHLLPSACANLCLTAWHVHCGGAAPAPPRSICPYLPVPATLPTSLPPSVCIFCCGFWVVPRALPVRAAHARTARHHPQLRRREDTAIYACGSRPSLFAIVTVLCTGAVNACLRLHYRALRTHTTPRTHPLRVCSTAELPATPALPAPHTPHYHTHTTHHLPPLTPTRAPVDMVEPYYRRSRTS